MLAMTRAVAERLGPEFVDQRLQELAVGQVGAIVSFLGSALARLVTGGVALFNVFTLVTVTPVCAFPFAMAVRTDHPAKTFAEFVAWAKRQGGAVPFASPAAASFDTPLDMLTSCHQKVLRCCAQLDKLPGYLAEHGVTPVVVTTLEGVLRYFDVAGPLHHADEERLVFPALLALGWTAIIARHQRTAVADAAGALTAGAASAC